MENPIRHDELSHPENPQEEPIKLRFHHISDLLSEYDTNFIHQRFNRDPHAVKVDFDQLYLYPDLVEERVRKSRESRQRNLKRHLRGRVAKYDVYEDPKEAKEMAEDYAGKRGANLQEHLDTLADVRRQLLLGDPNTRVDFTWGPDKICFACQSTESGQPGKHCLIPAGIDSNEGDSYRALEFLSGLQIAEGNIEGITEEDGKHSFSTNLGFLRSDVAMQTIEQKMKEFLFARNRRQNTRS